MVKKRRRVWEYKKIRTSREDEEGTKMGKEKAMRTRKIAGRTREK